MAQGNEADLFSDRNKKSTGFFSPQQQGFLGGMSRGVASAFSPQQKQALSNAGEFLTTPMVSTQVAPRVAPQPVPQVAPQARPEVSQDQRMMGMQGSPYAPNMDIQRPARMVREVVHHDRVPTSWGVSPEGNTTMSGGYTPNDTIQQVRVSPNVDTRVDLGGGSYFQAPKETINPAMSMGMQRAAVQSTPEELARRERDVANVDASIAKYGTGREAPQNMGMPTGGGMPQSGQRDYSEAIDRALAVLEKPRPSGDLERQIAWKNEVSAAKQTLGLLGGMQTAEGQQATQRDVASMNDQTDRAKAAMADKTARERTAAEQEQERQRTALGMAGLTSQDQERQSRMGLDKARFDREGQLAEQGSQQADAARQAYFNQLKSEGSGIIFDDKQKLQDAEAVRSGIISPAEMFKLRNKS